jgi:Mrp family chromosome partitioning ATPase
MALLRKHKRTDLDSSATLTLRTAEGAPLYTFASDVVTSMRHMETSLLYTGNLPARISVIAALRQEGVTYTTMALATTLAYDLAAQVCVVDLNWWSPGVKTQPSSDDQTTKTGSRKLRRAKRQPDLGATSSSISEDNTALVSATNGLAEVLTGNTSLDEALIPTALPNLTLLPAGALSPAQRAAMARHDTLKACIKQLNRRFDHILLDIPAILATSDAIALASLGTACCMVIKHGVTPVSYVQRALDDVKHLQLLGVILNQTRNALPGWVRTLIPQE